METTFELVEEIENIEDDLKTCYGGKVKKHIFDHIVEVNMVRMQFKLFFLDCNRVSEFPPELNDCVQIVLVQISWEKVILSIKGKTQRF